MNDEIAQLPACLGMATRACPPAPSSPSPPHWQQAYWCNQLIFALATPSRTDSEIMFSSADPDSVQFWNRVEWTTLNGNHFKTVGWVVAPALSYCFPSCSHSSSYFFASSITTSSGFCTILVICQKVFCYFGSRVICPTVSAAFAIKRNCVGATPTCTRGSGPERCRTWRIRHWFSGRRDVANDNDVSVGACSCWRLLSLPSLSPLATPMTLPLSPLPSHPSASLWCAFKTVSCALNGVFVFASSASPALAVMTPLGSVKVYPVIVVRAGYMRCLMKHTTIESFVYLLVIDMFSL